MGGVTLFNQHLFMKRERKQLQLREDKDKKVTRILAVELVDSLLSSFLCRS